MTYEVIRPFHDLQDAMETKNGRVYHKYEVGDTYPRKGYEAEQARIDELASAANLQGFPLIEKVEEAEKKPEEDVEKEEAAKKPEAKRTRKPKDEK